MKALYSITNHGKAYLLAQLFPEEIPGIIADMDGRMAYIAIFEKDKRTKSKNSMMSSDCWQGLSRRVEFFGQIWGQAW